LNNRIMVTDYEPKNDSFVAGKPRLWSDQQPKNVGGSLNYDLAPGGQRFAILPNERTHGREGGCPCDFPAELLRRTPPPCAGFQVISETVLKRRA
jgi:hypothetical protein